MITEDTRAKRLRPGGDLANSTADDRPPMRHLYAIVPGVITSPKLGLYRVVFVARPLLISDIE